MALEPTSEQLDELKAKHGDELKKIKVAKQIFILRSPNTVEYQRFLDRSMDEKKRVAAIDELTRTCIAFPDAASVDAFFARKPAAPTALVNHVLELAGVTGEDLGNV